MNFGGTVLVLMMCLLLINCSNSVAQVNVTDFGAVGDGKVDDRSAFLKAWKAICNSYEEFASFIVPEGKQFLLQPVVFEGPCQPETVHIQIYGEMVAPIRQDWINCTRGWIGFSQVNNLVTTSTGGFHGQGGSWEGSKLMEDCRRRPTGVRFRACKNLQLSGIKSFYNPRNHFSFVECDGASISDLQIEAPEDSDNTDGINPYKATDIRIDNCTIATGDDCIAISDGMRNVTVTNITCGPGHGISIGSLGKNGKKETVDDVFVQNCTFIQVQNGARIKTWENGLGYVKGVTFKNIILEEASHPIIIDQHYCPHGHGKFRARSQESSSLHISNVSFINFKGTTATLQAIKLNCTGQGCTDLVMDNVEITKGDTIHYGEVVAYCKNAYGKATLTKPEVPCVETY